MPAQALMGAVQAFLLCREAESSYRNIDTLSQFDMLGFNIILSIFRVSLRILFVLAVPRILTLNICFPIFNQFAVVFR